MKTIRRTILILLIALLTGCPAGKDPPLPTLLADAVAAGDYTLGQDTGLSCASNTDCDSIRDYHNQPLELVIHLLSHLPRAKVQLKKSFRLERHEVTNNQYLYCVEQGKCTPPVNFTLSVLDAEGRNPIQEVDYFQEDLYGDYPVVWVTQQQAKTYCQFIGRRLPTEAEWEIAARGTSRRIYPWSGQSGYPPCGDVRASKHGCPDLFTTDTTRVGSADVKPDQMLDVTPGDASQRIMHLASNVSEWVDGTWDSWAYCKGRAACPKGSESSCTKSCQDTGEPSIAICEPGTFDSSTAGAGVDASVGITRGGSYTLPKCDHRLFMRRSAAKDKARHDVGFRCAKDE